MIRPTPRALAVFAGALPVAALPAITGIEGSWLAWIFVLAVFVVLLALELAWLPPARAVHVALVPPPLVHVGEEGALQVTVTAVRAVAVELAVECEGDLEPVAAAIVHCLPGTPVGVELPLRPLRRGVVKIRRCHARWSGPLRMLWCETEQSLGREVTVVTNVRAVRRRALQIAAKTEAQGGLKIERYVGDGSEFDSLREFVVGMDRRSIDWKATARHRETLCREYRSERDHAVMLCIDTGRLMGEPLDGLPRLDHAIHAALQLGYLCLRAGDRVGMFAFADKPQEALLPRPGVHALQAIQNRMAALAYSPAESNFTLAMTELLQRLRRRTLVVLFTDFVDSVTAQLMLRNVHWLARRHLLLFVAMRDPLLSQLVDREPADIDGVHRAVIADEIRHERLLVLEELRRAGAQILDVEVKDLEPGLVARYLQLKRKEMV